MFSAADLNRFYNSSVDMRLRAGQLYAMKDPKHYEKNYDGWRTTFINYVRNHVSVIPFLDVPGPYLTLDVPILELRMAAYDFCCEPSELYRFTKELHTRNVLTSNIQARYVPDERVIRLSWTFTPPSSSQ